MNDFYTTSAPHAIKMVVLTKSRLESWLAHQSARLGRWVQACGFTAEPLQTCLVSNEGGDLECVLFGLSSVEDFWCFGNLPRVLPKAAYSIDNSDHFLTEAQYELALLAWGLGCYEFSAYRDSEACLGRVLLVEESMLRHVEPLVRSIYLARDLINTPAADMGPRRLAQVAEEIATAGGAKTKVIQGEALLKQNYPTIYAVGKGAAEEPRLVDFAWGSANAPKVTLVGKGVCFDSGGLDLKPSASMRQMKKDMGGAAHVLALAQLIMQAKLPVRLRVLIPIVENSIDAKSYHPGDIIRTRGGFSVEIDNTDAEGRLILCDALAEAVTESPDYLFDFATLTGAARVALGPDLPAVFSNDDRLVTTLFTVAEEVQDPLWRLPLYKPYRDFLKSTVADMMNASKVPMGGAITAALFLQTFVPDSVSWMHFDIFGSNDENRPGRPAGGEVSALRAVFRFLQKKYVPLR